MNYFTKASVIEAPHGTKTWQSFTLQASNSENIYFYLYPREAFLEDNPDLQHFDIEEDYVLSISDSKYQAAKNSL